jgi:drug/metabolite transporter (DMT)-like permease
LPEKKKPAARRAPARADRPFKGIALILASTVFLGTSDVTAKYLSATLPPIEITWIRFLVFALIMSPAMLPASPLYAMQTKRRGLQFLRGAALLGSSLSSSPACAFCRSRRPPPPASCRRCSSPRCRSSS